MKLVSYLDKDKPHVGVLHNGLVYAVKIFDKNLPGTMELFLKEWKDSFLRFYDEDSPAVSRRKNTLKKIKEREGNCRRIFLLIFLLVRTFFVEIGHLWGNLNVVV